MFYRRGLCLFALGVSLFVMSSRVNAAQVTATWTGGAGNNSYNDPGNWDIGKVPVNDATDTYVVSIPGGVTVNFDVPGTGHQVFQFTLPDSSTFVINSGRDLAVTDSAAISGIVNTANGQFNAAHASSTFGGSTSRVTVTGGGNIAIGAPNYTCKGLNGLYTVLKSSGTGSILNLSSLASIDAARSSYTDLVYTIQADNGGVVDLSNLSSVFGPTLEGHDRIEFVIDSGGTINLGNLTTTSSGNGKVRFDIRDTSGGAFALPSLRTSDDAEFIVAPGLTIDLGTPGVPATQTGGGYTLGDGAIVNYTPLTTLEWANMSLAANSQFNAPNLVDIDGMNISLAPGRTFNTGVISSLDNARFAVTAGKQWGVAQGNLSATSYSAKSLNGQHTLFSASDSGSVLDLSSITSIDASLSSYTDLVYSIKAVNGGEINLSGLTNISGPTLEGHDRIEFILDSGGKLNLSSLATTGSGNGKVRFDIRNVPAGGFSLPSLTTSDDAEFIVASGLTINLGTTGVPATQNGGAYTLGDGAIVNYAPLTTLQWANMSLDANSEFNAPNLVNIDGMSISLAPGRTFNTGVISSLDNARIAVTNGKQWGVAQGNLSAGSYSAVELDGKHTLFSASDGGSVLDLSSLASINAARSSYTDLVYTVQALNGGEINMSGLTNISGPTLEAHDRIEFIVDSGGKMNLSSLATTGSGSGKVRFDIRNTSGGAFALPSLTTSDDAEFIVENGLQIDLGTAGTPATQSGGGYTLGEGAIVNYTPLTRLNWAAINLAANSQFNAPNLVNIDGSSIALAPGKSFNTGVISSLNNARIALSDGMQWGVAQGDLSTIAYSCTNLIGKYTIFSATDPGTVLDLSTIRSINASTDSYTDLVYTISATDGGVIDLSGLSGVITPYREAHDRIEFIANTGGMIDLSSLHTVTRPLNGIGESRFTISNGGTMKFGDLQMTNGLAISVSDIASKMIVGESLHLGAYSSLSVTNGATLQVGGDFSYEYVLEDKLNTDDGILHFNTAGDHLFEVGGADLGAGSTSGNFGFGRLVVGADGVQAVVTLADLYDNADPGSTEALYLYGSGGLDGLEILGNSTLIIGDIPVYAWIDGQVIELHSLIAPGDLFAAFQDASGANQGWVAIPEPATLGLLALGGFAAFLRRKK